MKKYLLFVYTFLMTVYTSSTLAQLSVGMTGGYTKSYLYTNAGYRVSTQYEPSTGFSIGIPVRYSVNRWLAFQAEPQFIQKNYQLSRTGFYEGIYQISTNQYLQLPVMSHFAFGGSQLKGFLNLGGYAAYWAASRIEGVTPNIDNQTGDEWAVSRLLELYPAQYFNESYVFDGRKDRRLEIGWLVGAGLSYQAARYNFFAEGRYYQALSDQQNKYMLNQIPRYNQSYVLQIGCLYQLNLR